MSLEDDMKLINAARDEMNAIEVPQEAPRGIAFIENGSVAFIDARSTRERLEAERLLSMPCSGEVN